MMKETSRAFYLLIISWEKYIKIKSTFNLNYNNQEH